MSITAQASQDHTFSGADLTVSTISMGLWLIERAISEPLVLTKRRSSWDLTKQPLDTIWPFFIVRDSQETIQNFERVIKIVGADSEMGLECATQIEKLKAKKSGICFVATAACGDSAPEVQFLSAFRDCVLSKSQPGRMFIRGYYRVSPRLADWVRASSKRRMTTHRFVIRPCVWILSCIWKEER